MNNSTNIVALGNHRFLCGDITLGAVQILMGEELADVIYSDIPWGPGNQKYWHTMNMVGSTPRTSWTEFLHHFAYACCGARAPTAPVFVEMGCRWAADLDHAMERHGLNRLERWDITYGPKSKPLPNTLSLYAPTASCLSFSGPPWIPLLLPSPPHGEPVTQAVLDAVVRPGMIVLDPCTGLGMTARITHKLGGRFRGTELNAARLARAIEGVKRGRRV